MSRPVRLGLAAGLTALVATALPLAAPAAQAAPSGPTATPLDGHAGAHALQFVFLTVDPPAGPFYDQARFTAWTDPVAEFWLREARGQLTALTADWSQVVAAQSRLICADAKLKPAEAGAQALGYASYADYRAAVPAAGTTLVVVTPDADATKCDLSAAARSQGATTSAGTIWLKAAPATPTAQTISDLAHELGHIFGLGHAGAPSCPAGVVDDPLPEGDGQSECDNWGGMINNTVYGDRFNLMGNRADGVDWPLHAWQKVRLGLVGRDAVPEVTTAAAGVHTFDLADSSTLDVHAVQGVTVTDYAAPGDTRYYAIEVNARAGGFLIRRLGAWAGAAGPTASQILSPEGSQFQPQGSQVFPAHVTFTAASGHFSVAFDGRRVTVTTRASDVTPPAPTVCAPPAGQSIAFCPARVTAPDDGVTPATVTIGGADAFTAERWGYDVFTADPAIETVYWAPDDTGGLTLSVLLAPNLTGATRTVTIDFTPKSGPRQDPVTLTVDQPPYSDRIALSADSWTAPSEAATRRIKVSTNLDTWRLDPTTLPSWVTANLLSGTDGSTTLFSVTANTGSARGADVVFTAGSARAVFHIDQPGVTAPAATAILAWLRQLLARLRALLAALSVVPASG